MGPMPRAESNGIELEYETFGERGAASLLLIGGLGTREERIELGVWAKQKLLGPADPYDDAYERSRVVRAVDRAYHPAGFVRQLQAIAASPSRLERLRSLGIPTLVIHGDADILVPVENGRRVAAAIPGSRLLEIEGMGHDIPRRVWPQVVDAIAQLAREASPAC